MRVFVSDSGCVDLEAPIQMTSDQRAAFIAFFKKHFGNAVLVADVKEKEKEYDVGTKRQRRWTIEEYAALLDTVTNQELEERLDRTEMSVQVKRGRFVPDFTAWLRKKGYILTVANRQRLIEEYIGAVGEAA